MTIENFVKKNALQIADLKGEFKNLFSVETIDGFFIFRPMTKGEFSRQGDYLLLGDAEVEEIIFKTYVLMSSNQHTNISSLHAGTITVVAAEIVSISGFGDEDTFTSMLSQNRENMDVAENQIIELIIRAFPYLTPEDIDNYDIQQLTYRLALAERITGSELTFQDKDQDEKKQSFPIDFKKENQEITGLKSDGAKPFAW